MPDAHASLRDRSLGLHGGTMGRLVRDTDWTASPLGPPGTWPEGLRVLFATCLECRFPFCMWWGRELGFLYNDAYAPILGDKHPGALGRAGREVWAEIWDVVGPMLRGVIETGEATHARDLLLLIRRSGYLEETYFEFSYSPIRDHAGTVVGIFTPVVETTDRVVGERRLRTLRDLAARGQSTASADEACRIAAEVLAENPHDIPFALIYRLEPGAANARLVGRAGAEFGHAAAPPTIAPDATEAAWPLVDALRANAALTVGDLPRRFADIPTGAWLDPPTQALVLPIGVPGQDRPAAILIAGVNPRRVLDEGHRGFHTLIAGQIATALARALAYEEERRRAEALAELDRAKTVFFTNISHEFRTPLTLMLGPLEELLGRPGNQIAPENHVLLEVAHRNGLRLLRLVNALLDFARVEAGRTRASYEPMDLAVLTAELAGNFRSACERAGLSLDVDCPVLPHPVFVDRDMWEKIVLNLVSNAFKFTLQGRIAVTLRAVGEAAELSVRDTGVGIPAGDLPHLFERFHRGEGTRGRSMEGTGIGLALVQELVKLHGGAIEVESEPGRGSAFMVRVPFGADHLPAEHVAAAPTRVSTPTWAPTFVAEALRWLPDSNQDGDPAWGAGRSPEADRLGAGAAPDANAAPDRPRVLVADDNADMRDYVRRLLHAHYEVEAVADGQAALDAARRHKPDLVLTDVMMPRLDGFALLRALREEKGMRALRVILLSARAGEEARIEGLEAGADDYLAKPFSARELLARVRANLDLARVRKAAGAEIAAWRDRYEAAVRASGDLLFDWDVDTNGLVFGSELEHLTGYTAEELAGGLAVWARIIHPEDRATFSGEIARVSRAGDSAFTQYRIVRKDGRIVDLEVNGHFVHDPDGRKRHMIGFARDVTERKRAEAHQRMLIDELNHRVKNTLAAVQAIARQSLRGMGSVEEMGALFTGRLMSLSQTHNLLTEARWQGAGLREVAMAELSPYREDEAALHVRLRGPAVYLSPKAALALGMALHELATNAAKHGALSVPAGRVEVAWDTRPGPAEARDGPAWVRLTWTETGGPHVAPPCRRGFGSRLLERGLALELRGSARLEFEPTGVRCEIEFPLLGADATAAAML